MIYAGDKRAVICKGDFHPTALFKGEKKICGYTRTEFEAEEEIKLENCYNDRLYDVKIAGKCVQEGTPTPEEPIEIESVGELVSEGEYAGKYKIPIKVRGKNMTKLFPEEYTWYTHANATLEESTPTGATVTGYLSEESGENSYSRGWFRPGSDNKGATPLSFKSGDTVTVSADITLIKLRVGERYRPVIHFYPTTQDKNYTGGITVSLTEGETKRVRRTFTLDDVSEGNNYYPVFTLNGNTVKIENIQTELGDTATPYEPYKEEQSFEIYASEPLRGIGASYDCVDFERGVIVRNIGKKVMNGKERNWAYDTTTSNKTLYLYEHVSAIPAYSSSQKNALCNRLEGKSWSNVWQNYYKDTNSLVPGAAITYNANDMDIYFKISPYTALPTVEEWKEDLKRWNDEGNPFTMYYVKAPTEEAVNIPVLPTRRGTEIYSIGTKISTAISGNYKKGEKENE